MARSKKRGGLSRKELKSSETTSRRSRRSTSNSDQKGVFGPLVFHCSSPGATTKSKRKRTPSTAPSFPAITKKIAKTEGKRRKPQPKAKRNNHHLLRDARLDVKHKLVGRSGRSRRMLRHPSKTRDTKIHTRRIRPPTQLEFPVADVPYDETPWYQEEFNETMASSYSYATVATHHVEFPTSHVSEDLLQKLDRELLQFSRYVRLTPVEEEARSFVISKVCEIARRELDPNRRKRKRDEIVDASGEDSNIWIEAFGSYATKSVCMFSSDVDLAVWGVVPTPQHSRFVSNDEEDDAQQPLKQKARVRESQVQRWREALAELDAVDGDEPVVAHGDDDVVSVSKDRSRGDQGKAAPESMEEAVTFGEQGEGDLPLSIIDREGAKSSVHDAAEAGHEEITTAVNSSSMKAEAVTAGQRELPDTTTTEEIADGGARKPIVLSTTKNHSNGDQGKAAAQRMEESFTFDAKIVDDMPIFVIDREGAKRSGCGSAEAGHEAITTAVHNSSMKAETAPTGQRDLSGTTMLDEITDGEVRKPLISSNEAADYVLSDSDVDTADKLEALGNRKPVPSTFAVEGSAKAPVSEHGNEDSLEVSYVAQAVPAGSGIEKFGPTGETRVLVVRGLKTLGGYLRGESFIHTVDVRNRARVPIVCIGTRFGFETDIAVGGHNGTDTSKFASAQVDRFTSFAPVVLFLKALLSQQALDKPFTGGLGSYKLYVLVASHLEQHLGLGGNDRPSEVIVSFLYRYELADSQRSTYLDSSFSVQRTPLTRGTVIRCDGGSADLQPVFQLDALCETFRSALARIRARLKTSQNAVSFLSCVVNADRLYDHRQRTLKKAQSVSSHIEANDLMYRHAWHQRQRSHRPSGEIVPSETVLKKERGPSQRTIARKRARDNRRRESKKARDNALLGLT